MKKILLLIVILFVIIASYFLLGFYNVSATKPHMKVTEIILHLVAENSIKRNSGAIINPFDIDDKELYVHGFKEYDEMCVQCHGWSGIEISPTGKGLNPKPPHFPDEELYEYTLEDIYWVTKNGIKMTGMPGYGPTHEEETLWSIAIFLDRSRELDEKGYKNLQKQNTDSHSGHLHGD